MPHDGKTKYYPTLCRDIDSNYSDMCSTLRPQFATTAKIKQVRCIHITPTQQTRTNFAATNARRAMTKRVSQTALTYRYGRHQRDIHLVGIKYCKDARPQNQLNTVQETGRCSILRGASVTLHTILLGVGGTIYNNHTLESFKELGLNSQRVKKVAQASCSFCQLRCQTCSYQTCPFQHCYQLSSETIKIQAYNPPDPDEYSGSNFFSPSFCQALAEDRVTSPTKKKYIPIDL